MCEEASLGFTVKGIVDRRHAGGRAVTCELYAEGRPNVHESIAFEIRWVPRRLCVLLPQITDP